MERKHELGEGKPINKALGWQTGSPVSERVLEPFTCIWMQQIALGVPELLDVSGCLGDAQGGWYQLPEGATGARGR